MTKGSVRQKWMFNGNGRNCSWIRQIALIYPMGIPLNRLDVKSNVQILSLWEAKTVVTEVDAKKFLPFFCPIKCGNQYKRSKVSISKVAHNMWKREALTTRTCFDSLIHLPNIEHFRTRADNESWWSSRMRILCLQIFNHTKLCLRFSWVSIFIGLLFSLVFVIYNVVISKSKCTTFRIKRIQRANIIGKAAQPLYQLTKSIYIFDSVFFNSLWLADIAA